MNDVEQGRASADVNATLTAMREMFHQDPSSGLWDQLRQLLEETRLELDPFLSYALEHLQRWPEALRCVSPEGCQRALVEGVPPWWPLAASASLMGLHHTDVLACVERGLLSKMRHLDLKQTKLGLGRGWADTTPLEHLESLVLAWNGLTNETLKLFLSPHVFPSLGELDLQLNRLGDKAAVDISRAFKGRRLERLNLSRNVIGRQGVSSLKDIETLSHLAIAEMGHERIATNLGMLEAALQNPGLSSLDFSRNPVGLPGVYKLVEMKPRRFRRLNVSGCQLSDHALKVLIEGLGESQMTHLNLSRGTSGTPTGSFDGLRHESLLDQALHTLARTSGWDKLEALDVSHHQLSRGGLEVLMSSSSLTSLKRLDLRHVGLDNDIVSALQHAAGFERLERLNITGVKLYPESLIMLGQLSDRFPSLRRLSLGGLGEIGQREIDAFRESPLCQQLDVLKFERTGL